MEGVVTVKKREFSAVVCEVKDGHYASKRRRMAQTSTLLAILFVGSWGCSTQPSATKEQAKEPAIGGSEPAKAPSENVAPEPLASENEDLLPVLRTAWKGDLDQMAERRVVRVLVPFQRPEFFYMEGRPVGILFEAFQEIERRLNKKYNTKADNRIVVAFLPTSVDRMRERMSNGFGDIAAGSISITERNQAVVDFTIPTLTGLKVIAVTGPGAPELTSATDLSGKEVWVMPQSRTREDLLALNEKLKSQGKAPAQMREADPVLEPGDVMEMVNAGVYPIALTQDMMAEFWAQVFDGVKVCKEVVVAEDVQLGWAIQKNSPQLKAYLDDFLKTNGIGTAFGNTLMRRYLKGTKYVRNASEASELQKFRTAEPLFRKYADQYSLDYLLLAAQGYQESRLDQNARSQVGAVGIMQVMPTTAASSPVNVKNIDNLENNINAGVKLIHFLIKDYFNEPEIDTVNRMLFAAGAYNAGPSKITRCREMAKEMGYNPDKWFGNVEVAVAKVVGRETTQYVANIYKYYIMYRMATAAESRRDAAKKATQR